ncbi:hypothetical protein H9Q13_16795 [Pontibacter sp. JH31]|uniref:Uncharacterized protein n=1 Tax=Pontibacter aquaedesilientis TaxID=2766980 RepID=A0ABR7XKN5_9BACT|nr:hypothetical protein [Pontibacter aquaedesilientis]MBD1398832.1 hypothetical protein [Pontibacter aquaedesilientis]
MKDIYAPFTSEQFDQVFRFGYIYIPAFLTVEATENNEELQRSLARVFTSYLPFVYDENYLIIKSNSLFKSDEKSYLIRVTDIEAVFPISEECEKAVTLKKSAKIKFSPPIFSKSTYTQINNSFFSSEAKRGTECLAAVFSSEFDRGTSYAFGLDEVLDASLKLRNNVRINTLPEGTPLVDYVFLYMYQAYYPLTTLGYFYRTAEILTRKALTDMGVSYNEALLEKTDIYQLLNETNYTRSAINLKDIVELIENDTRSVKFVNNLTKDGLRFYITIPMFLKVIDEFNERNQQLANTSMQDMIRSYKDRYPKECELLITWLGAYLGYGNCYDFCYEKSNLKFFKGYVATDTEKDKGLISSDNYSVEDFPENIDETPTVTSHDVEEVTEVRSTDTVVSQMVKQDGEEAMDLEAATKPIPLIGSEKPSEEPGQFIEQSFLKNNNRLKTTEIISMLQSQGYNNLNGQKVNKNNLRAFLKQMKMFNKKGTGENEYYEMKTGAPLFTN